MRNRLGALIVVVAAVAALLVPGPSVSAGAGEQRVSLRLRSLGYELPETDVAAGALDVEYRPNGRVASIAGTVVVPGAQGGTAELGVDIDFRGTRGVYVGTVDVHDPNADVDVELPVRTDDVNVEGVETVELRDKRPTRIALRVGPDVPQAEPPHPGPTSIVQLGDSIASAEGTYYGYTYKASTGKWSGGDLNVKWDPPYDECHDARYAYVHRVSENFEQQDSGPPAVAQFACSGATFANGITTAQSSGSSTYRPAQFGNWATQQNLNAEYDQADPDLVLVTLGADDVQFAAIIEACIKNGYWHYWLPRSNPLECVTANPGPDVTGKFLDFIPTLKANYQTLVSWIEARAEANNKSVPKIVFTNYVNPLPPDGGPANCPDTSWLYPEQVQYLASLVGVMNDAITTTIDGLNKPHVAVADISSAYTPPGGNHRWCNDDPWAYGLSIYSMTSPSSFNSLAPFHPTPDGQNAIADLVIPAVEQIFAPTP